MNIFDKMNHIIKKTSEEKYYIFPKNLLHELDEAKIEYKFFKTYIIYNNFILQVEE